MPDPQDTQQLLEALALTGATTVVAAMATEAWQAARTGTTRLFHHGGQAQQDAVEARLNANAALAARAPDMDRARQGLVPVWQLELEELMRRHPDAAGELQALVDQVQAELPRTQKDWVQTQTNIARDHGIVYAVQHGTQHINYMDSPNPRPPATLAPDEGNDWA